MAEAFDKLYTYITQFPFVRYALIVGVLIALCSSLLGVTLVLKRFSFIGDGLSHVAFGAMAIAAVLKLTNSMPLILCITVISAILLLRTGKNAKIKGDAAVAVISVSALAIGYESGFDKDNFDFDEERDLYICPNGKEMHFSTYKKSKGVKVYRPKKKDCDDCPYWQVRVLL